MARAPVRPGIVMAYNKAMKPPDDPSVFEEPQFRAGAGELDPSERRAAEELRRQRRRDPDADLNQSVFDEPNIFPNRDNVPIEQDWTCSRCGYNLRGLRTGQPCPECGHIELYCPSPPQSPSYQNWLRVRIERTPGGAGWRVAFGLALLGGIWAVLAALSDGLYPSTATRTGIVLVIVFGPAIEESMKIGAAALIIETHPYVFQRPEQIRLATLGAALCFAIIENFLYLHVYIPNPSVQTVIWRWTVCVALHVGCTSVATRGLVRVWERTISELRAPSLPMGLPALVTAIILHACYNAAAVFWEFSR